jgi:hypothetical protein
MPQPDGDIHLQIGHLLKLRGMLPEAREAYLACLAVEPDNPHAKREIATMLGRGVSRLAPPAAVARRPYTEVPLVVLPGERMRISRQHGLACFSADGPDPQLELAPDGPGWPLPPDTYGLLFEVVDGRDFVGPPTLYIDEGEGYCEAGAVELRPVSANLWFREFATTSLVRRLRFDPADNAVTFALLRLRLLRFEPPAPPPHLPPPHPCHSPPPVSLYLRVFGRPILCGEKVGRPRRVERRLRRGARPRKLPAALGPRL